MLAGDALAPDGGLETIGGLLCGCEVFGSLRIDPSGGQSVDDGGSDGRIVGKGDPGNVSFKSCSDRNGELRSRIAIGSHVQIDDEILDHGPALPIDLELQRASASTNGDVDSHQVDSHQAFALSVNSI
jgi:hypothetical protein